MFSFSTRHPSPFNISGTVFCAWPSPAKLKRETPTPLAFKAKAELSSTTRGHCICQGFGKERRPQGSVQPVRSKSHINAHYGASVKPIRLFVRVSSQSFQSKGPLFLKKKKTLLRLNVTFGCVVGE